MFYHGGMTLGYLTAPQRKEKEKPKQEAPAKQAASAAFVDDGKEQEFGRFFLTPWHLFY